MEFIEITENSNFLELLEENNSNNKDIENKSILLTAHEENNLEKNSKILYNKSTYKVIHEKDGCRE